MASKNAVDKFRQILRRCLFLTRAEGQLFDTLPEPILEGIFQHNFNGNMAMAERVLFNRYKQVDRVDRARLEQEKKNIHNMARAAGSIAQDLAAGRDVLFVTDNDNDGSLAQAVLIEFIKALPEPMRARVHVEYAQPIGETRGFNLEVVDLATQARGWDTDHPFTLVTADNGINSRDEQARIAERYPASTLVVTDHHLPDPEKVVVEDDRSMIVNPKYMPTAYFQSKNISGANTLGVLLGGVVAEVAAQAPTVDGAGLEISTEQRQALDNMVEIGSWANLLDYANADMADMPTRPYVIEKALDLRPLLNVSNSMSNLITGRFSEQDVADVLAASNGIQEEWLREKLEDIATLNIMARKLLGLYHRHTGTSQHYTENGFYSALSQELMDPDFHYSSINPNYIEQLRPIIFNLSAIDNKDLFMTLAADTMVGVYDQLRHTEKEILSGLREVGLLRADKRANSTILYPVDPSITKIFNRRLLGKAYNQDNNGFSLILSSFHGQEVKGSMRSLYPIQEILEGKRAIEDELGVELEFQGHPMAAGFFVRSANGQDITEAKLGRLNAWIDERVGQLKAAERINQMPNLELDFASVGLATKINSAVKANLAGMWGLPSVIRFSPNKGDQVWVTDPETTEQVNLAEVVRRKHFGYQAITTDFGGGAMVVPVELLRSIVDSGYTKGLRMSYMDEGVFMGSQVVDMDAMPNLVVFKGGREDQEALVKYYQETFKDTNFIPVSREDFRNSPYFRYNRFGQQEFERWESLMIRLLDKTSRDVLAVVDTEGTGLGKAPKCFNIGGTNIAIDPTSGKIMDEADFEARYFRDDQGHEYLLAPDQVGALIALDEEDGDEPEVVGGSAVILRKMSLERGVEVGQRFACPGRREDLEAITNLKMEDGEVIYNRTISGFAFSFLVNNKDFAITKEFEDLTGIGNWMVDKLGRPAATVDKALADYYAGLKNMHGEPAKVIFQAHNMPYDKGVVAANFQLLNTMMDDHLTSDTAKLARQAKLAYDDTPVSSFDGVEGLPAKAYFYDSPYSDYSLSTFLARCQDGKGGVFPDTTAKLLLRYNPETERFSVIDRKANREVELAVGLEDLVERKQVGQMPNNAVRYSVERMSARAMIRNIILLDKPKPQKVELRDYEAPFRSTLEAFQENYHFDAIPEVNISHFVESLARNDAAMELREMDLDGLLNDLVGRFLDANRELQAKFHDGWIYEKVLAHFEPVDRSRVADDVIEQINYYTDLPDNKIREVLDAVVRFKEHFGIKHALVHEQHNNIRQHSEDGQGLSDTAYESVLPGMLAMTKFYNPYFQSTELAATRMVEANIKGSLIQHMLGDDYNNELARDSFSVRQMLAFSRTAKTDIVKQAQALASGRKARKDEGDDHVGQAGEHAVVKFKLSGEILPPGSAIYAKPKRHVSQEEITRFAQDLEFILVNEQVKSSVRLSNGLDTTHCDRLMALAAANDGRACQLRDQLLEVFETVEFSRKDADLKKVSDMMKDVFSQVPARLPRNFKATQEQADTAREMLESFQAIFRKMGQPVDNEEPERLVELLEESVARQKVLAQAAAEAAAEAGLAGQDEDEDEEERYVNPVCCERFLPQVDIVRREPLKFVLKHHGPDLCFRALREQAAPARARSPGP